MVQFCALVFWISFLLMLCAWMWKIKPGIYKETQETNVFSSSIMLKKWHEISADDLSWIQLNSVAYLTKCLMQALQFSPQASSFILIISSSFFSHLIHPSASQEVSVFEWSWFFLSEDFLNFVYRRKGVYPEKSSHFDCINDNRVFPHIFSWCTFCRTIASPNCVDTASTTAVLELHLMSVSFTVVLMNSLQVKVHSVCGWNRKKKVNTCCCCSKKTYV